MNHSFLDDIIMALLCFLFCSLFMTLFTSFAQSQPPSTTDPSYYYNLCAPSSCGNLSSIKYPFALPAPCHQPDIRSFCRNNETLIVSNLGDRVPFRVLSLNFTENTTVMSFMQAADSLFACGTQISKPDYQLAPSPPEFQLGYGYNTIGTHFNCTASIPPDLLPDVQTAPCLGCEGEDPGNICYYSPGFVTAPKPNCENFFLFTHSGGLSASGVGNLRAYLQKGFEIRYTMPPNCSGCEASGGRCGYNPYSESGPFVCFCKSSVHPFNCSDGMTEDISNWGNRTKIEGSRPSTAILAAITIPTSLLGLGVVLLVICFSKRRKATSSNDTINSEISLKRYSYAQLKMFTDDFSVKLGSGGFGTVYKGTVHRSGSEVPIAVKVLKKCRQTEKQFMSEITTVGSIHHDNLVWMLGYCIEGDTHALVYESLENKSLDKHIYKLTNQSDVEDRSTTASGNLNLEQSYNIALQIARGIQYLHNGCSKKILHCDIKPSNILLDSNFSAKVGDFGLSRMIGKDRSHVSLTTAQGTPGYAAPEIWLKTIGPVTEKSDVYSYGMLILEMIGRRKNYDAKASSSDQVYFPEWLYNNITILRTPSLMRKCGDSNSFDTAWNDGNWNEKDEKKFQRICLVGLWCIQYLPSSRPSMNEVIQMLEGNTEIVTPTHPFPLQSFIAHECRSHNSLV